MTRLGKAFCGWCESIWSNFFYLIPGTILLLITYFGMIIPFSLMDNSAGFENKNKFSAAFNVKEWWPIFRSNLSGFLLSSILVLGTFIALNFVSQFLIMTIILCTVYPVFWMLSFVYVSLVGSSLFAQAYSEATQPRVNP